MEENKGPSPQETSVNPLGKKIFFINLPTSIDKQLLGALHALEFEAYYIDSYRETKTILRRHPYSIALIYVDSQLSLSRWFNFICSFKADQALSTINLGIMTSKMTSAERGAFLTKAPIDCGIINLNSSLNGVIHEVLEILERLNAKGIRKYVRSDCMQDPKAVIFWTNQGQVHQMKIVDISVVGAAVKYPIQNGLLTQKGAFLENITLVLAKRQIDLAARVYAVKIAQDSITLILLFENPSKEAMTAIRSYASAMLQHILMTSINGTDLDKNDYSEPDVLSSIVHTIKEKQEAEQKAKEEREKNASSSGKSSENNENKELSSPEERGLEPLDENLLGKNS